MPFCKAKKSRRRRPAFSLPGSAELNPLQLAYVGDTLHDLYVRSMLVAKKMSVGAMHRQAVKMVSAAAQAAMLTAIEDELTEQEADMTRRGRNAQANMPRRSTQTRRIMRTRRGWRRCGAISM